MIGVEVNDRESAVRGMMGGNVSLHTYGCYETLSMSYDHINTV